MSNLETAVNSLQCVDVISAEKVEMKSCDVYTPNMECDSRDLSSYCEVACSERGTKARTNPRVVLVLQLLSFSAKSLTL